MNETAVLLGDGLDSATSLTLCIAGTTTCTQVANADVRASSAKVTLPSTLALDVFTLSAANSTVQLNAPCVWWRQADVATHTASAGGWARVFGSSLAFANGACVPTSNPACGGGAACGARARLVPVAGGAAIDVPVTRASCFALDVAVPPGTPLGDYLLQVVNGLGASPWADTAGGNGGGTGGGGCSVARGGGNATTTTPLTVVAPAPWPSTVYNVVALGSVWAALDAARAAGGGVVYFPRGRYAFDENHTMNSVPPRTTLQGESADTVELYWRDMREPPRAHGAPTALIQGEAGFFAVKNVSLYAQGQYPDVISDGGFDGLIVAGVIIRADPYFMLLEPVNQSFHGRSMPIGSGANSGVSVSVSGSNWRVEDCDIVGGSHAVSMFVSDSKSPTWFARSRNGVLARNTLDGGFGVYRCEGVDGLIVEDNVMRGGGLNSLGSWISTYYAKSTSGVYMARNTMSRIMGGDRELLSFDGGGGAYGGAIAAVSPDGRTLTLATDPTFAGYIPPGPRLYNYTEAAVLIMKGRGEGQVRRVISNDWTPGGTNRSWVLDMPYDVAPDATSFVSIVPFRGDIIIAGNDFVDGGAIQLYAMAVNTIVAENTATRTSGFLSWGLNPHGWGIQPNFMTQFLDNTVLVGNAWGGQTGGLGTVSSGYAQISGPMNRGIVMRRNALLNNAAIVVGGNSEDVIVEHCTVANNDVGVAVANTTAGVLLRGNTFANISGSAQSGFDYYAPGLSCCCNDTDAFTGVKTVVKPFVSYTMCTAAVGQGSCEAAGMPDPW